jgi:hypothetical protein
MTPPIYTAANFGMITVETDNLPYSITGYAEATCGGEFPYVPPTGYMIKSCTAAGLGTHGGCNNCLMSRVTCVPVDPPIVPAPVTTRNLTPFFIIGAGILAYGIYRYSKSK